MVIVEGKDFSFFDVDDTLVSWRHYPNTTDKTILFEDPSIPGKFPLEPIEKTITALKQAYLAGSTVVVWSAGGWDWAKHVIETLNLEEYVDVVMSKPTRYYDDLNCMEFMGTRYDFSKDLK